jgi:TolA-binding protein
VDSDQNRFDAICKAYQTGTATQTIVAETRSFLKKYPHSSYNQEILYIMASCLGDTKEALDSYLDVLNNYTRRNKQRRANYIPRNPRNRALITSSVYKIAQIYYDRGEYEKASQYFSRLGHSDKSFITGEALHGLAQTELVLGDLDAAEKALTQIGQANPLYEKEEKVLFTAGLLYYRQGKYAEACDKFSLIVSTDALYCQGKSLEKLEKHVPAVVAFRRLLALYPGSAYAREASFLIGENFFLAADYVSALTEYRQFVARFPDDTRFTENALYRIGCCYFRTGEYDKAAAAFTEVCRKYPAGTFAADARYMIAESLLARQDFTAALNAYQSLIADFPKDDILPFAIYKSGWCSTLLKDHKKAIETLKAFTAAYPQHKYYTGALFLIAENYRQDGDPAQAITCFEQVLNVPGRDQEYVEASLFMICKTLSEQKKYGEMISSYHFLLSTLPPSKSEWRSYTYLLIGEAYYYLGMLTEAEETYNRITAEFPYEKPAALAREGKAWVYFQGKKYALASEERQTLMDETVLHSNTTVKTSSEFEMGNILFNEKKYAEALDAYENFMKNHSGHELIPDALFNAGRCYYKLEYYSKATELWEQLAAQYPKHALRQESVGLAADTHFRAQRYPQAIRSYQTIIADYPDTELAKQAKLRIAQSYFNLAQDADAVRGFAAFLDRYPDDELGNTALEGLLMAGERIPAGDPNGSLDTTLLQNFLATRPQSKLAENVQYRLAERYYVRKDFARAADGFEKVYRRFSGENVPNAHFYLAESLYYQTLYDEAVPVYQRFIDNYPKHENAVMASLHCANALYYLKKYAEASDAYMALTARKDADETVVVTAMANAALCYRKAEKWEESIEANRQLVEKYPKSDKVKNALLEIADMYELIKQTDKALPVYAQLLRTVPANDPLRTEMQYRIAEYHFKKSDAAKAVEEFRKLLPLRPADDPWRLSGIAKLAQEYEQLQDWSNAVQAYQEIMHSSAEQRWVQAAQEQIRLIQEKQNAAKNPQDAPVAPTPN